MWANLLGVVLTDQQAQNQQEEDGPPPILVQRMIRETLRHVSRRPARYGE